MGKTAAGVRDSWRHRIPVGHSSSDQPINLFRRLDLCLTNTHDFQVTPLKTLKFNTYNNTYVYDPVVLGNMLVICTRRVLMGVEANTWAAWLFSCLVTCAHLGTCQQPPFYFRVEFRRSKGCCRVKPCSGRPVLPSSPDFLNAVLRVFVGNVRALDSPLRSAYKLPFPAFLPKPYN